MMLGFAALNPTYENQSDVMETIMTTKSAAEPKDGDQCEVIGGTHKGKSGTVRDINISKTGHMSITVVQKDGERFKTLAKNVTVKK